MSDSLQVEAFTSLEEIKGLQGIWNKYSSHVETDFQLFINLVARRPEFVAPCVLLVKCRDVPVAMLVGRLEKTSLRTKLGYFSLPALPLRQLVFVCYGNESLPLPIAEALAAYVLSRCPSARADLVRFSNCLCNGTLYESVRRLPNFLRRDCVPRIYARWRLHLPESYEAFFSSMHSKKRWRLKSHIKHFETTFGPDITYRLFTGADETERFFAAAGVLASISWQSKLGMGFLNGEEERRRMVIGARNGWWRAYVLYVKDRPLAYWACEFYRNELNILYTAYDPEFQDYHVGTVLLLRVIRDMCENQARCIDFGVGAQRYKENLSNECLLGAEVKVYGSTVRGLLANVLCSSADCINRLLTAVLKLPGVSKLDPKWMAHREIKSRKQLHLLAGKYVAQKSRTGTVNPVDNGPTCPIR
jgi:hypothetical protein